MSKLGQKLIKAAKEGRAIVQAMHFPAATNTREPYSAEELRNLSPIADAILNGTKETPTSYRGLTERAARVELVRCTRGGKGTPKNEARCRLCGAKQATQ